MPYLYEIINLKTKIQNINLYCYTYNASSFKRYQNNFVCFVGFYLFFPIKIIS